MDATFAQHKYYKLLGRAVGRDVELPPRATREQAAKTINGFLDANPQLRGRSYAELEAMGR